jgi:serine/threonine-protein kinase RsbW
MAQVEEFTVVIPSETAAGQAVQGRIIQALEAHEFPPHDVFAVRLALEEALVNAIKHGNGMDPDKSVHIQCAINAEKVRIEIQDEGNGFRPDEVPDPTTDENLERPCGRGLMLMRSFMSLIEFNEVGNRVTLEKIRETVSTD